MYRKVVLTFFTLLTPMAFAMAQEGDPIEPIENDPAESEVIIIEEEADSAYVYNTPTAEQIRSKRSNSNLLLGLKLNSATLPAQSDKTQSAQKAKANTSKSSYNFLYYLFFKSKKGDYRVD